MDARVLQIRALDKKTSDLKSAKNIVPQPSGWIKTSPLKNLILFFQKTKIR